MSDELKPCPWCGSADVTAVDGDVDGIFCDGCGFYWSFDGPGDNDDNRAETIARWNARPIEDALRARIAQLEAQARPVAFSERLPAIGQRILAYYQGDWADARYDYDTHGRSRLPGPFLLVNGVPFPAPESHPNWCWLPRPDVRDA